MFKRIETKWLVAIAFVFGLFMEVLDMTVLNTALPTIGRDFGVDQSTLQYLLTGYLVSLAIFIPASGWVADHFGSKWTFAFAIAVFTGASALAGAAPSFELLVAARILQGVGGGMLTPVGTTMLFRAFPPAERARASAILAVPVMIAPALGPVLGGWLTDNISWRWIFYLNLPIGIVGLLFTLLFVPNEKEDATSRFDLVGFILAAIGVSTMLVGLERIPHHGWNESTTLLLMGIGAVALTAFVFAELRIKEPLLNLRLLQDRNFAVGNVVTLVSTAALMGILFLIPLMLQQLMGLDATQSGLVTVAQVAGMMLVMPIGPRLYPKLGAQRMMAIGFGILAVVSAIFSTVSMDTSLWVFRGLLFIYGTGIAFVMVPSQTATFETISHHDTASASSFFSTARQFASAAGVALISTILTSRINANVGDLDGAASQLAQVEAAFRGYEQTFLVSTAAAILGIGVAFLFRKGTGRFKTSGSGDSEAMALTPAPAMH